MLVYSQLIKAQLENLAADPTPVSDGLVYFHTGTGFPRYYDSAAWRVFVDEDSPQILLNKDYDGGTASNSSRLTAPKETLANLQALTRKEGTIVYATDTQSFLGDNGSVLAELGGGGGNGEINAIDNPSASTAITGWVASGAGITVARTTTGSDLPLSPIIDAAIKITPVSGTDYVRFRFTMPEGLKGKKLKWEWYQLPLSGYLTGDIKVEMYKNSASNYSGSYTEFNLSTDVSGDSLLPNASGKFTTYFHADDGDYYELRFVRVSGTTALNITNVIVGPGIQAQGAVVTNWQPYTPTISNLGTVANVDFYWKQDGSDILIKGTFQNGTVGVATEAFFTLPNGWNINTQIVSQSFKRSLGYYHLISPGGGVSQFADANYTGMLIYNALQSTNTLTFSTGSAADQYNQSSPTSIMASSAYIDIPELRIPIAELAGAGTVNLAENAVQYASNYNFGDADDATSFAYGPAGSPMGVALTDMHKFRISFPSPILPTDEFEIQISAEGLHWFPMIGYIDSAGVGYAISALVTRDGSPTTANSYGVALEVVNETDVDVWFGCAPFRANGFNTGWNSFAGTWRYRVRKSASAAALGFAEANATASGLVGPMTRHTPVISNTTNVDTQTYYPLFVMKMGNYVFVQGIIDIDATAGGTVVFRMNLPYSTTFSSANDAQGILTAPSANLIGQIYSVASTSLVEFIYTVGSGANQTLNFQFMYEII